MLMIWLLFGMMGLVVNAEHATIRGSLSIAKMTQFSPLKLVLNNGEFTTFARKDGTFQFRDIPSGRYSMDVVSEQFAFSQYKVDISAHGLIRVLEYKYPGAEKQAAEHPVQFTAHAPFRYFKQREKMGIATIVKNPSFFMLLLTGLMVFVVPRMMANMDPEEVKEMQAQMSSNDPQSMLKNMFGGNTAAIDDDDD